MPWVSCRWVEVSRRVASALLLAATLVGAACGNEPQQVAATEVDVFDASLVPTSLAGLAVAAEDVGGAPDVKNPFVDGVGLYSLREGELLQGTLQLSRFTESADSETARFRQSVVRQIGSTTPKAYRMGDRTVYLTAGKRQTIAVWFEGRYFFVLSTREEFPRPRALIREALEITL